MNSKEYQEEFGVLSASGVGVVATRTREPFRAIEALRDWAFAKDLPFGCWNVRDGWTKQNPTDDPEMVPPKDGMMDPYMALQMILDVPGSGRQRWEKGVYVMHATHHWLDKHPGLIECLRHYVRDLPEIRNLRLVLVFPEGFSMPDDLKHDIPLLDYDLPDSEERSDILDYIIESSVPEDESKPTPFTKVELDTLIASSGGMTQMEAETAFSKAIILQKPVWPEPNFEEFNRVVLNAKTEIVKNSDVLEMMDAVPMEEVGGLEVYKEWIEVAMKCFTPEAREFGVDAPKGCVCIGPPGTGKSLVGKATGAALRMPVVKFDVSRIFAGIVGESESRARGAIKMIEAMAPCVAFVDEIDKGLGGAHKGGGDSGVSQRTLGIILTAMQESKAPIFWMASANRTDGLPPELLRKGRFDEVFAILTPNRVERESILRIHLAKRGQQLPEDINLGVDGSRGYVGAEIEAAVKEAVKVAFVQGVEVTGELIKEQLDHMRPLKEAFPEDFAAMERWAELNARAASYPVEEAEVISTPVRKRKRSRQINS
jgi:SpoVK/Ycf46/Vps4 family AAA+-type ATPase